MTAQILLYSLAISLLINFFAIRAYILTRRENKKLIRNLHAALLEHGEKA